MIEAIIIQYLNSVLNVSAYAQRPENAPSSYVLVEKTASSTDNLITTATIAVQSYAPTLLDAAKLNESVKASMPGLMEKSAIGKVKLNTDYNFTNTTTKQPRYQALFTVVHY